MIAGVSRAAAGQDVPPAAGQDVPPATSTTAAPSVTEPASAAAPTDAPASAETGGPVAEPPTSAGAPGTVVPDGVGRGAVIDPVASGPKDPGGPTEEQRRWPHRGGLADDRAAGWSADADSPGPSPDATVQPGEEARAGAVAPTGPRDDAAGADSAAGLADGNGNPESPTNSGTSPSAERQNAIADPTGADAPATAPADPASVVDSGPTMTGTATTDLPPAPSPAPAPAVFAPAPADGDQPSTERRSGALAGLGAAAVRLGGRQPATRESAVLRSGAAPGPAAVALQPFADAPSLGWKPAERSGAAAKPNRGKRARAARADTGYRSGVPSAPNGRAVGTSSSAASAGGGGPAVPCALLLAFALAAAPLLRRHRLRLVVSAPAGFSTLLERPG
jgi:hypothetical protein